MGANNEYLEIPIDDYRQILGELSNMKSQISALISMNEKLINISLSPKETPIKETYKISDISKVTGYCPKTVLNLIKENKIKATQAFPGASWKIPHEEFLRVKKIQMGINQNNLSNEEVGIQINFGKKKRKSKH